mgnify:FL=1
MGRPKKGARVLGPYRDGDRWKVIVVSFLNGKEVREQPRFTSEEAANDFCIEFSREDAKTIGDAIGLYLAAVGPNLRPKSRVATKGALDRFFPNHGDSLKSLCDYRDRSTKAALLYRDLASCSGVAVATHHVILTRAKAFLQWCCAERLLPENPLAGVRCVGVPGRGKPQHKRDEARKLFRTALGEAQKGDLGALCVAMALLLGVRQSELTLRRVRDIDNVDGPGPLILKIPFAKTKKGVRERGIPRVVEPLVRRLIDGRAADDWLFPHVTKRGTRPHSCNWLNQNVKRLCQLAQVSVVCAHALRGGHATFAVKAGVSPEAVSSELGHTSFETTRRHYVAAGTMEDQEQEAVEHFLEGLDEKARLEAALAKIAQLEAALKAKG